MADWLTLHGLSQRGCEILLKDAPTLRVDIPNDRRMIRSAHVRMSAEDAWASAAKAFAGFCPPSGKAVQQVLAETRTNFNPDSARFPRPFTLHDGGDGRPYVSCHYRQNAGDLMSVAHEFGHALQVTAAPGLFFPPILREACAFVAEIAVLRYLEQLEPDLHRDVQLVWCSDSAKYLGELTEKLRAALMNPAEIYSYRWNYPPARIIAMTCTDVLEPADIWRVFTTGYPIGTLLEIIRRRSGG